MIQKFDGNGFDRNGNYHTGMGETENQEPISTHLYWHTT